MGILGAAGLRPLAPSPEVGFRLGGDLLGARVEGADLHRRLDLGDSEAVGHRPFGDDQAECAADVSADSQGCEVGEYVELVGAWIEVDCPSGFGAEGQRQTLDFRSGAAQRPHGDRTDALLLGVAVAAAGPYDGGADDHDCDLVAMGRRR